MSEPQRQQSEFNDAIGYLNRLNYLFYKADISSSNLDTHGWFHSLVNLYRELSTEMSDEEIKKFDIIVMKLNTLLNKSHGESELSTTIYMQFHGFEMELRKVFKESGLQNKMKDEASGALR